MDSYAVLEVTLRTHRQKLKFYIAELEENQAILGFSFLKVFNTSIDWHTRRLSGKWGIKIEQLNEAKQILRELQIKALKLYGIPEESEVIYLKQQSFAQQWTTAAHKTHDHLTEATLPVEYQNYSHVFNQDLTAHFPLSRAKNFTITLKPDTPDHLDCKVYPLNKKETIVAQRKIQEGLEKGQLKQAHLHISPQSSLLQRKRAKTFTQ
jgi:hypothetical protein